MFADLTELADRWRTLTAAETPRASRLLGDANRAVKREYPTVPARAAADPDFAADVAMIVCNMVKRAMTDSTPGVSEETDRRGPFALTRKFSNPDGDLGFTAREESILQGPPAASTGALPVFTGTC